MVKNHKYDIAISFLAADEPLAVQVADALAPLNVFVFSKKQEQLAGTDGVESFREIFRNEALVSLVLYRRPWGETPWTRVEETAIKDSCLASGWSHLMFVRLEQDGGIPKWVPDSYLYMDFQTFGLSDLVGAVKAKLAGLGVDLKPPSAAERAVRAAKAERFQEETKTLLRSGAQIFYEACSQLFEATQEKLAEVRERTGWTIYSGFERDEFVASVDGASVATYARELYANTASDAYLSLGIFRGRVLTNGERRKGLHLWEEPKRVSSRKLVLDRVPEADWCWKLDGGEPKSVDAAAEALVHQLLDARERFKRA